MVLTVSYTELFEAGGSHDEKNGYLDEFSYASCRLVVGSDRL